MGRGVVAVLVVLALVVGCTGGDAGEVGSTGDGVVDAVGAHEVGAVRVEVPEGAFDAPLGVRVSAAEVPAGVPGVLLDDSAVVVSPEDGVGVRSDEPLRFTVSFDPSEVAEVGELVGIYHHPVGGWSLLRLDAVDLVVGQASFETFHLSWFGAARLSDDERIAAHIERSAAREMARAEAVGASQAQIEATVAQILEDGAGVSDRGALEVITRAVVSNVVPQGKLAVAIYDGDVEVFVEQVASLTGQALVDAVGDDAGIVDTLTGEVAEAVNEAAELGGRLSQTDLAGVAEQLGRKLIESVPVVSTLHGYGEAAAEVIDELINEVWLDPEIEKAFRVYRDGAEGGWFGYSVDAGDWDAVSSQMRGAMRQYRINAIDAHCRVRDCVASQLTTEERQAIGDAAEAALKDRFDARIAREPELAAIEQARSELYDQLGNRGLLTTGPTNPIWREGQELEDLLDRLEGLLDRVRSVAGRQTLITAADYESQLELDPDALPAQAAVQAIGAWYDADPDDREQALRDVLTDWDLIEPEPQLDLTGTWELSFRLTRLTGDEGEVYTTGDLIDGRWHIRGEDPESGAGLTVRFPAEGGIDELELVDPGDGSLVVPEWGPQPRGSVVGDAVTLLFDFGTLAYDLSGIVEPDGEVMGGSLVLTFPEGVADGEWTATRR